MNVQETGECVKRKKIFSGFRNAVEGKVRKWNLPIHIGDNKPLKDVETYFKSAGTDAVSAEDDSSQTSISPEVQRIVDKTELVLQQARSDRRRHSVPRNFRMNIADLEVLMEEAECSIAESVNTMPMDESKSFSPKSRRQPRRYSRDLTILRNRTSDFLYGDEEANVVNKMIK